MDNDDIVLDSSEINDQLLLVVGETSTGKSASLREIRNQERWMYFGTEAGKRLPFKNKFDSYRITEPFQVIEGMDYAIENKADIDGVIIDSITFLMDMFESQYIIGAADGRTAWGQYQQFFKTLMNKIAVFGKPVIVIAHTKRELDEGAGKWMTAVPIKGALKNNGVEALEISALAA